MKRARSRLTGSIAVSLTTGLLLASCGGGAREVAEPTPTVSPSVSSTVDIPEGVALTEVGADLSFGDTASVIYELNQKRGSVLDLTVQKAAQGTVKDFSGFVLDDYTRAATPYYVDVRVRNVGDGDLGGAAVPLWGVDGENTLLPAATFMTTFRRCPSERLPEKFPAGASFSTCLVFLAPDQGTMRAVSFRPNQEFDPIEWTGEIATPAPEPKKERPKPKKERSKAKKAR